MLLDCIGNDKMITDKNKVMTRIAAVFRPWFRPCRDKAVAEKKDE